MSKKATPMKPAVNSVAEKVNAIFDTAEAKAAINEADKESAPNPAQAEAVNTVHPSESALAQDAAQKAYLLGSDLFKDAIAKGNKSFSFPMRTVDFMGLRSFGFNRDTKRINKKNLTHLKGELNSEQQKDVAVVLTDSSNGKDYYNPEQPFMKIDGHSRTEAWLNGQLAMPEFVNVKFYFDLDDEQIITEYKVHTRDATTAEKNDIDNKLQHFAPVSGFCKASWKGAFIKAGEKVYAEGLKRFTLPIMVLDGFGIDAEVGKNSTRRHSSGVRAAILETYKEVEDGLLSIEDWAEFWKLLLQDAPAEEGKPETASGKMSSNKIIVTLMKDLASRSGGGSVAVSKDFDAAKSAHRKFKAEKAKANK